MRRSRPKGRETEAKFLVRDPKLFRALGRLTRIGRFRLQHSQTERQINLYLDTPDLRLKRAHAALKIRRIGRRAELTFKREISYRRGVSERREMTVPLRAAQVPVAEAGRLDAEPVRIARRIAGGKPWRRVLLLETRRRKRSFVCPAGRIELALDEVQVRRKGGATRYREVELENLGAPGPLFRQALSQIRRRFGQGLRPSRRSKYQIGLRLARA